jgi:dTDP-glucose 4,6-dehydratase
VDDPSVRRPDTTLAERSLGWHPRVSTTEGLRRTITWFARRMAAA